MKYFSAQIDLANLTASNDFSSIQFTDLNDLKKQMQNNKDLLQGDLDDFRRAADNVRMAQLGSILCASNIKNEWTPEQTAIIGINGDGCSFNNRIFWDDFVSHGRESGRATLFVPTLPSIPVCEAAITLKIKGPVRYIAAKNQLLIIQHLLDTFLAEEKLCHIMTAEIWRTKAAFRLYDRTLLNEKTHQLQ